jgi:hypothetical protein
MLRLALLAQGMAFDSLRLAQGVAFDSLRLALLAQHSRVAAPSEQGKEGLIGISSADMPNEPD